MTWDGLAVWVEILAPFVLAGSIIAFVVFGGFKLLALIGASLPPQEMTVTVEKKDLPIIEKYMQIYIDGEIQNVTHINKFKREVTYLL